MAKAVRRESEQAICYWWGVRPSTVRKWCRALGVGIVTEGTRRLFRDYTKEPWAVEARTKAYTKLRDPEPCRKISEAHRGKPKPPHVMAAVRQARQGMMHTAEARRK